MIVRMVGLSNRMWLAGMDFLGEHNFNNCCIILRSIMETLDMPHR
jgi:hypothetical protein